MSSLTAKRIRRPGTKAKKRLPKEVEHRRKLEEVDRATTAKRTHRTGTKAKKSFTLSRSSVAFLERLRKEKKATSTSQVLDELIADADARRKLEEYDRQVTAYYDSLTDEERGEERAWAVLARRVWEKEPTSSD